MVDYRNITTRLCFTSFSQMQFGRGFVCISPKNRNEEPTPMFIHNEAEAYEVEAMKQVQTDCADLARLLGKFRIANGCLSTSAIAATTEENPDLEEHYAIAQYNSGKIEIRGTSIFVLARAGEFKLPAEIVEDGREVKITYDPILTEKLTARYDPASGEPEPVIS